MTPPVDEATFVSPHKNRPLTEADAPTVANDALPDLGGHRYDLRELIATGGMGAVYRAWDRLLCRDVAVKVPHTKPSGPTLDRFRNEATTAAQLQHPNIPPVYDVGALPDGRPFLAMKLVVGRTLDTFIRDGSATLDIPAVLEAVAQAIGYAHDRGILHRDLKPANVMVGAFGEVQVMDWGLAKSIGPPSGRHPAARPAATGGAACPSAGDLVGTPAYMAPEQASGAPLTPAADVFGLGGVLCALLTGAGPFADDDSESSLRQAAGGAVGAAHARLDTCGAPAPLIELAKRCLAARPAERPANGSEVAVAVARIRLDADDRARRATLARAVADARRRWWVRGAAAVLLVLAAGTAAALWQTGRATTAEAATREQLTKTVAAEAQARAKGEEAEAALRVAGARTDLALGAFRELVFGVQERLEERPGTQDLRKALLGVARDGLEKIVGDPLARGRPDRTLFATRMQLGDLEQSLGHTAAADREYRAGDELLTRLRAADPANAELQHDRVLILSRLGDTALTLGRPTEARELLQRGLDAAESLLAAVPADEKTCRVRDALASRIATLELDAGRPEDGLAFFQTCLPAFQRRAAAAPAGAAAHRDLGVVYTKLGDGALKLGHAADAEGYFRQAFDVFDRLAAPQDLAILYGRLGDAAAHQNRVADARRNYEREQALCERLAVEDPKDAGRQRAVAVSHEKLGNLALAEGRRDEARDRYRRAAAGLERLAEADPANGSVRKDQAILYEKLGAVAFDAGQTAAAADYHAKAAAAYETLVGLDPRDTAARRSWAVSCSRLGDALLRHGRTAEARAAFERWHALAAELAAPDDAAARLEVAKALTGLGDTTLQLGDRERATAFQRQALAIRQALAAAAPGELAVRRELGVSHDRLGNLALQAGQFEDALGHYGRAAAVAEALAAADPANVNDRRDHAAVLDRLGLVSLQLGRPAEALAHWGRFNRLALEVAAADPTNARHRRLVGISWVRLGEAAHRLGRTAEALEHFRRGVEVARSARDADPASLEAATDLFVLSLKFGNVYKDLHRYADAVGWFAAGRAALLPWHEKGRLTGSAADYVAMMDRELELCRDARRAVEDVEFVFGLPAARVPDLALIRVKSLIGSGRQAEAIDTAERLANWAELQGRDAADHCYNAACAVALCCRTPADPLLDKALALLQAATARGYFTPATVAHFKRDSDFDGIRTCPKFVAFVAALERGREAAPRPREK
ncbi:serine/threonine-protein kinase [Limnoglobus roseus]|uniref:Serine/threonine protein kinase n=1 Tax=Limnoglobus roseus TaxID=2598579 RepID=A0A5C1ARU0_9BACT|nr:serine/threonine-protein kinase [Limnoglobus roseus]QEL20746.1 serine/threonine protein kinase [Limnoglobus roseus]